MKKEPTFKGAVSLDAILKAKNLKKESEKEVIDDVTVSKDSDTKTDSPIEEKTVKKEDKQIENKTESYLLAKKLIELKLIKDFELDVDGEVLKVSDFFSMTPENLEEIISIQNKTKKENLSKNYISKEGLNDYKLKIVDILKNGGDLSSISNNEEDLFKMPFEGVDLDNKSDIGFVLLTDLTTTSKLSESEAITLIKSYIKEGTAKQKAEQVVERYVKAQEDYVDELHKKTLKKREDTLFQLKENKNTLIEKLKDKGLKEASYKKIAQEYYKTDEDGNFNLLDVFKNMLQEPDKYSDVILHVADPKMFKEISKIEGAFETQKEVVRLATGASKRNTRKNLSTENTQTGPSWKDIIDKVNKTNNK